MAIVNLREILVLLDLGSILFKINVVILFLFSVHTNYNFVTSSAIRVPAVVVVPHRRPLGAAPRLAAQPAQLQSW